MGKTFRFNPDKAKKAHKRIERTRKQKKSNGNLAHIPEQFAPINPNRKNLAPYWQAEFDGYSAQSERP